MAHHKVRIQRKRKSDAQMMFAWSGMLMKIVAWFAGPYIDQERARIQEAKLEKVQVDARVQEQRAAKEANNVVLGDMKIEEMKMKLRLLERELEIRGLKGPRENDGDRF